MAWRWTERYSRRNGWLGIDHCHWWLQFDILWKSNISDAVNEIINKIVCNEKIKEDVQSCVKDLLDSVEEKNKDKKKLMRKRSINKQNWAASKRKKSRDASKEYISSRGKKIPAKKMKDWRRIVYPIVNSDVVKKLILRHRKKFL